MTEYFLNNIDVVMIKSFRRNKGLSNNSSSPKHSISRVGSSHSANTSFESADLQSPKKVIKALYDYQPQGPGELKFLKGDFFHVLTDGENKEHESNGWCEATNPMTNLKGMVPISYFEVFNRSRPMETSNSSSPQQKARTQRNSNQTLYAVTLYEFKAEREDELDIIPGENLIICAHHAFEWFIAKPINRLGGPGLVPVLYVKIIDLVNPLNSQANNDDMVKVINDFKIPTVEEWKDQTAKYQASTIPLGSISNQAPPVSSHTQFFQREAQDASEYNRSSLSLTNTSILEATVDSYQLDQGRYQYLIIAKLSNGKTRYLYRYYQDFYDLQVKLLELFPYEAGKIENSKRIIPSIPGPLINVNDSISKLRREKLDYYLRNLIALPPHISKSDEVLRLLEVLDNGFDKEASDNQKERRSLKPISQKSNYQQDRISQYSNFHNPSSTQNRSSSTPTSSDSVLNRSLSSSSTNLMNSFASTGTGLETSTGKPIALSNGTGTETKQSKIKAKFYYDDDIFVLLLPTNLRLRDLKSKLCKRLSLHESTKLDSNDTVHLFLKNDYDDFLNDNDIANGELLETNKLKLSTFEINDDEKFQNVLYDKCKLTILV